MLIKTSGLEFHKETHSELAKQDHKTFDDWFKFLYNLETTLTFRELAFETFCEVLLSVRAGDPNGGLSDYTPIASDEDYGVDGYSCNAAGTKVAVQIKFRTDTTTRLGLTDIGHCYWQARELGIDLGLPNSFMLITTCAGATPVCLNKMGRSLVVWNKNCIKQMVDNNTTFWKIYRSSVVEALMRLRVR